MSQDSLAVDSDSHGQPDPRAVVGALADDDCRAIVEFLDDPATAGEVADGAEVPLSTTYRKLDRLVDAGLVTERTDALRRGQPTTRYRRAFETVRVEAGDGGSLDAVVEQRSTTADDRLEDLWTELRMETSGGT
jgi:DNA-binding transcriptional ArsR family regulator